MYLLFKSVNDQQLGIVQRVGTYMYFTIGYIPDTHVDIVDYRNLNAVVLPDDVLKAAVDYSIQYIPQRTLPDKAIDLIDMTAAHLAAKNSQTDVETLDQRLKKLEAAKEAAIKAVMPPT